VAAPAAAIRELDGAPEVPEEGNDTKDEDPQDDADDDADRVVGVLGAPAAELPLAQGQVDDAPQGGAGGSKEFRSSGRGRVLLGGEPKAPLRRWDGGKRTDSRWYIHKASGWLVRVG